MAFTASTAQPKILRYVQEDETLLIPGDPGDAHVKGDILITNVGTADPGTDSAAGPIGIVNKSVTISAATVGMPPLGSADMDTFHGQLANERINCFVEIRPLVAAGTPILEVAFTNYFEDTLAAYTAGTPSVTLTTSPGANDDCTGGLIYVHAGTGRGQWNVIADYDHGTKVATLHRKFETAVSTDSEVILFENASSALGAGFFGRVDLSDEDQVDVADGTADGDFTIYLDARMAKYHLNAGTLPLVSSAALHLA